MWRTASDAGQVPLNYDAKLPPTFLGNADRAAIRWSSEFCGSSETCASGEHRHRRAFYCQAASSPSVGWIYPDGMQRFRRPSMPFRQAMTTMDWDSLSRLQ